MTFIVGMLLVFAIGALLSLFLRVVGLLCATVALALGAGWVAATSGLLPGLAFLGLGAAALQIGYLVGTVFLERPREGRDGALEHVPHARVR